MNFKSVGLAALFAISAAAAQAVSIPGLVDTGVGTPNTDDPAWQITADPDGGSVPRPATILDPTGGSSPFSWYSGDPVGSGANWIGPNSDAADQNAGVASGDYTYQLQFDLTGYDPSTASFVYESAADNLVISASLNGVPIPFDSRSPGGGNQFASLSSDISVAGPFVGGVNTLTFTVENPFDSHNELGNSTHGFLFVVQQSNVSVPEQSTFVLAGLGFLGVVLFASRKRPGLMPIPAWSMQL